MSEQPPGNPWGAPDPNAPTSPPPSSGGAPWQHSPAAGMPPPGYAPPPVGYGAPSGYPQPYGYNPYGAPPVPRPGTVTAASVITFVASGFGVLGGIALLALAGSAESTHSYFGSAVGGIAAVFGLLLLAFAGLGITAGVFLLRGSRAWGIVLTVLYGLSILGFLGRLGSSGANLNPVLILIDIAAIICIWAPASRRYYESR